MCIEVNPYSGTTSNGFTLIDATGLTATADSAIMLGWCGTVADGSRFGARVFYTIIDAGGGCDFH
jgi:hypothetical protein